MMVDRSLTEWLLRGYAVVRLGLDEASAALEEGPRGASTLEIVARARDVKKALEHMAVLTMPATRHLLFQVDRCTMVLSNGRLGTESGWSKELAQRLAAPVARIVDQPGLAWTNGRDREVMDYETRIFELFDAAGECMRSIACVDDGGQWVHETAGEPHPLETSFPASARRVKDRFTTAHLRRLAEAYGFQWLDAARFEAAPEFLLIREWFTSPGWLDRIEKTTCTIEEANDPAHGYYVRGMGFVPWMETHAESVIADLERATRLNPEYRPRVEPYLVEAHRVVRGQSGGGGLRKLFKRLGNH